LVVLPSLVSLFLKQLFVLYFKEAGRWQHNQLTRK
jgi:hypothetical protein